MMKIHEDPFLPEHIIINRGNAGRPILPENIQINEGNARRPLLPEQIIINGKMHVDPFHQSTL